MQIHLNGQQHPAEQGLTLAGLVEQLALTGKRFAVEVNEELIPRSEHPTHVLHDGDKVEIVEAIGGG